MATSVMMSAATPCLWGTAPGWGLSICQRRASTCKARGRASLQDMRSSSKGVVNKSGVLAPSFRWQKLHFVAARGCAVERQNVGRRESRRRIVQRPERLGDHSGWSTESWKMSGVGILLQFCVDGFFGLLSTVLRHDGKIICKKACVWMKEQKWAFQFCFPNRCFF